MKKINTVCGPVSVDELGVTLMHEHQITGVLGWRSDIAVAPFNHDEVVDKCAERLIGLKQYGVKTVLNPSPICQDRQPLALRDISEKSGVNLIACTGLFKADMGCAPYWNTRAAVGYDTVQEMYELYMKELTEGMEGTDVKAGVIKVGSGAGTILPFEEASMKAAAKAAKETGAPIITHTDDAATAVAQAELFLENGVDPSQVVIGHMCDYIDMEVQEKILSKGFTVGFDRMGLCEGYGLPSDEARYPILVGLLNKGYADKIVLSTDSCTVLLGRPNMALSVFAEPSHIFTSVIPELKKQGITDEQINTMMVENPCRIFSH